jgi:arylsulfatase A-like enzyme
MPTFLALSNTQLPENLTLDGQDLSLHLLENAPLAERNLFWRYRQQKTVRAGKWKLLIDEKEGTHLFNLEEDLREENNLVDQFPEQVQQLSIQLQTWEQAMDQTEMITN